jgi:hypothetical protein
MLASCAPVRARVRHLMGDDQVMVGIDGDLHIVVVADHAGPAPACCHRPAVGISQGDLLIG